MPIVPFKLNQDRRHHIPRQQRKVTNWPAYDASLRQRGSLTVWFTDEAVEAWVAEPRTTRGGQPWYSALAILTALTLRAVFRLAFRQTEGLIGSIIGLLGLTLRVPDHTTLSRRAATVDVPRPRRPGTDAGRDAEPLHLLVDSTGLKLCGAGEWLLEKRGTRTRRSWRKLHLGVDADTGQIVAAALTTNDLARVVYESRVCFIASSARRGRSASRTPTSAREAGTLRTSRAHTLPRRRCRPGCRGGKGKRKAWARAGPCAS